MPLIESPRHTQADLEAWHTTARYDTRLWPTITARATRAAQVIRDFAQGGDCYAGCSWGKDSLVVAHLIATHHPTIPIVWVRVKKWENPDCELVRDAFLTQYPHITYDEITVDSAAPRRWEADTQGAARTSTDGFTIAKQHHGQRHISGVRAQESTTRRLTIARNGEASTNTCRPLAHWTGQDVFTYLAHHDLPIHPAYAMTYGGALNRDRVRVGTLGGERGTGVGRAEWEETYYPDVVRPL